MHMEWNPFMDKIGTGMLILLIILLAIGIVTNRHPGVPFVKLVHGNVVHGSSTATLSRAIYL
jgi:hypothetical protein